MAEKYFNNIVIYFPCTIAKQEFIQCGKNGTKRSREIMKKL